MGSNRSSLSKTNSPNLEQNPLNLKTLDSKPSNNNKRDLEYSPEINDIPFFTDTGPHAKKKRGRGQVLDSSSRLKEYFKDEEQKNSHEKNCNSVDLISACHRNPSGERRKSKKKEKNKTKH